MTELKIKDQSPHCSKHVLAEVISREDYLNALELIDKYHRQFKAIISEEKEVLKSIFKAKRGDFVICKYVNGANQKCLTKNKKYEIIDFDDKYKYFWIIDDNNKRKRQSCDTIQFSAL